MATGIASVRERTRSGAANNSRPAPKRSLQGDHRISNHLHAAGHKLRHHASDHVRNLRSPRARSAYTGALNLRRGNAGDGTSLTHSRVQSFPRPRLAQPDDIAPASRRRAQHGLAIAHRAGSLGCSAVDAKADRHALVLTYPR